MVTFHRFASLPSISESSPPLNDPRTIKPKPKDTYFHSVLTYYKSVLSSVSLFLTSERHTILTRCTSTVGTMGGIDRRASNAQRIKGGKRRESTCLIHALPTMAGYLNEFVVKVRGEGRTEKHEGGGKEEEERTIRGNETRYI